MNYDRRSCLLYEPGKIPYPAAWEWQKSLVEARRKDASLEDVLILLEHPPVYTLGQGSDLGFLKFDPDHSEVPLVQVERGGEVTYHCPGQLVGYPILNLAYYQKDLHWYLRQLEAVLIQVIGSYGLPAERMAGLTGVWVEGYKLSAIGIKVSRWITMHGFSLNVCPDLAGFERIVPCGIADRPVGTLAQFIPDIQIELVQQQIAAAFAEVFGVQLIKKSLRKTISDSNLI